MSDSRPVLPLKALYTVPAALKNSPDSSVTMMAKAADSAPDDTTASAPQEVVPRFLMEPRLWQGDGWTARVLKNEDDDGWAVAMYRDGETEPALTGPWTMGRDKKNPKPLDVNAFHTLVKTASEFVRRHEQQLHAALHQQLTVSACMGGMTGEPGEARYCVALDIEPDEDHPYATLSAFAGESAVGEPLAVVRVAAGYRLSRATAVAWIENGCQPPATAD